MHVHEIKVAALLAIGSHQTVDKQARLAERPKAIVVLPLPRLPPPLPGSPALFAQPNLPLQPRLRRSTCSTWGRPAALLRSSDTSSRRAL
jgi:hypothetical protein